VDYATADGTATAGSDYVASTGMLSFGAGIDTQTISVTINGDAKFETNETVLVNLTNLVNTTGTATIADSQGVGTITNDDTQPTISIDNVSHAEGNAGTVSHTFTVTLSNPSYQTVTVNYATADGSATTASGDYAAASGTLTFAPGEISKTITVLANGDTTFEGDETFTVTLSTPTNATITTGTGTGTIVNDDAAPANGSLSIDSVSHSEGNSGTTNYTFTVSRTGGTDGAVTADYTFAHVTTDASDFGVAPAGGTVSFADGETSKTITVTVAGDVVYEANETFNVTLSNATGGATLGTTVGTGTIVNDDPLPTLSISDPTVTEGDAGTVLLTYTVTSSSPAPAGGITFNIATADGTATVAGNDYVAHSVTGATIAAGDTTYTFTVTVNGDTVAEANETVLVNLSSPTNATIADAQGVGHINNDDGLATSALIFSENFTGFTAAGFSPNPTAGQLNSNIWRVVGLSDVANPAYGFTATTGDFARGTITGTTDPATAGVYSPTSNNALIIQPTGAELDVGGFIEAKIQNTSGYTASSFDVAFDWAFRNNATRSEDMQLSYSTDGVHFTAVPAANFSTPGSPVDANGFVDQHESVTISGLFVGDQGYLYLRWTHLDSTGPGSRDEVGIDNLVVTGGLSNITVGQVADVSVAEGDSGTTALVFTVTRSGGTGAASVDFSTADGTAKAGVDYVAQSGTVNFADGETSKTVTILVNGDTHHEANDTLFLNLSNPVGMVLPDAQATGTITNDDGGPVAIYDIQGAGHVSPFAGQVVTTHGVVTAVDSNGFYLQDATGDGDNATSDAVFVFTNTAPTVVVGNEVDVTATVQEFTPSTAGSLSITELTSVTDVTVTNASVALPDAVLISTDGTGRAPPTEVIDDDGVTVFDAVHDGLDFWESMEGMRVTIQTPRVVGNTDSFGGTYVVASDGVGATGLNSHSGMSISPGDNNPETVTIGRDAGVYAGFNPNLSQGDTLGNVTGVITYTGGQYQITVTEAVTVTNDVTQVRETSSLVGDATHLSYVSFNVENLASVPDSTVDARNTQEKVDAAFAAHANEIVHALNHPDIIGLQEIQDADGIGAGTDYSGQVTAQKLIDAIVAAGGPTYVYVEIAPTANNASGGEPNGNIRPGFLYNPERVSYVAGSAHIIDDPAYAGTRKPLVADFVFNGQTFTAIDTHSTSRGGSDPLFGADQPATEAGDAARTAQGQAIATYIAGVLGADPTHQFIVNGDFNGFYDEGGLLALEHNFGGTGVLDNLYEKLTPQERYSYYFDGYYQTFDHILVSQNLTAGAAFDVVHYNAGFSDGASATDHDQALATIGMARTGGVATAIADSFSVTEEAIYKGTVLANDTGGDANLSVTLVNGVVPGSLIHLSSGALVTVHADGTFSYDTDGAFSGLATGQTATDSFTYTITGGTTATVTVTITGITNDTPSAGNDTIAGGTGNDSFDLSAGGNDHVSGGAGNDAFFFGAAMTGADQVNGGSGTNDQIGLQGDYTGGNALVLGANTISGIEVITGLAGFDYDITSNDGNVAAGDTLKIYGSTLGAGDSFTFNGSAETDGKFIMYGGLGADHFTGGAGDDGFYFGRAGRFNVATDHIDGGAGNNDQFALEGDYNVTISNAVLTNVEVISLLDGLATHSQYHITLADDWTAAGQTHTVYGVPVRDGFIVDASAETDGNIKVYGGLGSDTITTGAGNDWIMGGAGADVLNGGVGADTFVYTKVSHSIGSSHDIIIGFDPTVDKIDLPTTVTGVDAAINVGNASAATLDADLTAALSGLNANHAITFTASGGDLANHIFEVIDTNGIAGYQAGQDMVIELQSPAGAITDTTPFI
jgi:VCBS repeat-containing protein